MWTDRPCSAAGVSGGQDSAKAFCREGTSPRSWEGGISGRENHDPRPQAPRVGLGGTRRRMRRPASCSPQRERSCENGALGRFYMKIQTSTLFNPLIFWVSCDPQPNPILANTTLKVPSAVPLKTRHPGPPHAGGSPPAVPRRYPPLSSPSIQD